MGSDRPTITGAGLSFGAPTLAADGRTVTALVTTAAAPVPSELDVVLSGDRLDEPGFDPSAGKAPAGRPRPDHQRARRRRPRQAGAVRHRHQRLRLGPGQAPRHEGADRDGRSRGRARTGREHRSAAAGAVHARPAQRLLQPHRTRTAGTTASGRARHRWQRSRATSATTTSSSCWHPRATRPSRCGSTASTPRTGTWRTAARTPARRSSRSTSTDGSTWPPSTRSTSTRSSWSGTAGAARASTGRRSRSLPSAPYRIAGQVLLAPTDFAWHTAPYVPTVTVLPYCDGDVYDLQGQRFTDVARDLAPRDNSLKSSVMVMGANHNFFNTEWTPVHRRRPVVGRLGRRSGRGLRPSRSRSAAAVRAARGRQGVRRRRGPPLHRRGRVRTALRRLSRDCCVDR